LGYFLKRLFLISTIQILPFLIREKGIGYYFFYQKKIWAKGWTCTGLESRIEELIGTGIKRRLGKDWKVTF